MNLSPSSGNVMKKVPLILPLLPEKKRQKSMEMVFSLVDWLNLPITAKITAITVEFREQTKTLTVTACQKIKFFLPVKMVISLVIEALSFRAGKILITVMM